nr:MAG TPA: hypothetical protein [Caudoviricetes sp.]
MLFFTNYSQLLKTLVSLGLLGLVKATERGNSIYAIIITCFFYLCLTSVTPYVII